MHLSVNYITASCLLNATTSVTHTHSLSLPAIISIFFPKSIYVGKDGNSDISACMQVGLHVNLSACAVCSRKYICMLENTEVELVSV